MANIFNSHKFNNFLLCSVLVTFSVAILTPSPCSAVSVNPNDVAFGVRLQKLVDKVLKYKDKGESNKLLDTMIDMKQEVENYTGVSIDLNKQIDDVEKEIKKNGGKVSKTDMKQL